MKKYLLSSALLLASFSLFAEKATKQPEPDQVKNFSFYDMNGKTHNFSDYKGKWVLVNYWATYCPPCRDEIPDIQRFANDNKDKMVVLGMDAGGSEKNEIEAFKNEFGITYPLIPAQESTLLAFGLIMGIPTSFVVTPKGQMVDKFVGIITYDDLDYHVNPPIFKAALAN